MKEKKEITSAHGRGTHAIFVNKRVGVTFRLKKKWIGLLIDFSDGAIYKRRLKSRSEAKAFLEPRRRSPAGRTKVIDQEDFFVSDDGELTQDI